MAIQLAMIATSTAYRCWNGDNDEMNKAAKRCQEHCKDKEGLEWVDAKIDNFFDKGGTFVCEAVKDAPTLKEVGVGAVGAVVGNTIGQTVGAGLGAFIGGPIGAWIGSGLGSFVGSWCGSSAATRYLT